MVETIVMDKLKKLYIDIPASEEGANVDDFLVAIGKRQSNSVYHIAEVKSVVNREDGLNRYHILVFNTDLVTALRRDSSQKIIPVYWYSRDKK
jgi:hypothetical protein